MAARLVDRSAEKMVEDWAALMVGYSAVLWDHCWAEGKAASLAVKSADEMAA